MDDISLEEKVIQVFEKAGNSEACHGIPKKNDEAIVDFSWRKDCQWVLSVKKNPQKLKIWYWFDWWQQSFYQSRFVSLLPCALKIKGSSQYGENE